MMNYVVFAVEAALISNIALSYFLGLSPFPEIGKDKKQTCIGALAMVIVMTLSLSSLICGVIYRYILVPANAVQAKTVVFVVVILAASGLLALLLRKRAGELESGKAFPVLAVNTAVLGTVLVIVQNDYGVLNGTFYGFMAAVGYLIVIAMLSSIDDELKYSDVPKSFRGVPILLVAAGLMAIAFHGIEVLGG